MRVPETPPDLPLDCDTLGRGSRWGTNPLNRRGSGGDYRESLAGIVWNIRLYAGVTSLDLFRPKGR